MPTKIGFMPEEREEIARLYKSGMGMKKIAPLFGCGHNPIRRVLLEMNARIRHSKFTTGEEEQIAKIYQMGYSAIQLARAYRAGRTTINRVLRKQKVNKEPIRYALNETVFDVIDNEKAAYWWGFCFADGTTQKDALVVCLADKDRGHLEKFKEFLETDRPLYTSVREGSWGSTEPSIRAILRFRNHRIAKRLRDLGIIVGTRNIGSVIDTLSSNLVHHWLRGFTDGDGSYSRDGQRIAYCGSENLLLWIRKILAEQIGTNPDLKLGCSKSDKVLMLYYWGSFQCRRIKDFLFKDATIWLDRKKAIIDAWPELKIVRRDKKGRFTTDPDPSLPVVSRWISS